MNENTKNNNQILKSPDNKASLSIQKTNLFAIQKLNISDKDNQYLKKRHIKFICFKKPHFKVDNSELYKKNHLHNPTIKEGRWTEEEKNRFIQGIVLYGINWKKVKTLIPSRSAVQVRSHAQKFYQRMKLCKEQNLGIDFTSKSIKNIKDMINQIKSKNPNDNIASILNKLSHGCINRRFIKKLKKIKKNINEINNNISENGDKDEFIKLDENNNYINKNFTLNQNNMNLFDKNIINQTINNNCNINMNLNNNIQFKNINIIDNNIINNKNIIPPNILTNSLNLNLPNDILSNKYLDKFNNNLINDDYLKKTFKNDPYINYLSLLNDLLKRRIDLLNAINYIDSVYLLNSLQNFNFLIKNSLINNTLTNNNNLFINNTNSFININNNLINNNNPIINNNNLIISNNIPIINNNIPMINNNNSPLISNNIPIINNDNTLINNNNPIIDKNIPIINNNINSLIDNNIPLINNNNNPLINNNNLIINNNIPLINNNIPLINNNNPLKDNNIPLINNNNPIIDNYSLQIEKNIPLIKNQLTNNKDKENNKDNILIEINEKQNE